MHRILIGIIFGGSNCLLVSFEIAFNKTDYLLKFSGGPEKKEETYLYIPIFHIWNIQGAMQNYIESK